MLENTKYEMSPNGDTSIVIDKVMIKRMNVTKNSSYVLDLENKYQVLNSSAKIKYHLFPQFSKLF